MSILRCRVLVNATGVKQFIPFALEEEKSSTPIQDGVVVFNVFPSGEKVDMRAKPVFHSIIPCPYCGTENDRKHDPTKHINPKLGISIIEVEMRARAIDEDNWQKLTMQVTRQILSERASW